MQENYSWNRRQSGRPTAFVLILLVALLAGAAWGQNPPPQPAAPPAPQAPNQPATPTAPNTAATTQVPGAGVSVQDQQQGSAVPQSSQQPEAQAPITKAQAKE